MADFVQGLDPGKLVLGGAVCPLLLDLARSHPSHPGLVLYPQSLCSPGVQPPHLSLWFPRAREQRRRPVAQTGTPLHSWSYTH